MSKASDALLPQESSERTTAKAIMSLCDRDRDGKITWQELLKVTCKTNVGAANEKQVTRLISTYDTDSDGKLDESEIVGLIQGFKKEGIILTKDYPRAQLSFFNGEIICLLIFLQ